MPLNPALVPEPERGFTLLEVIVALVILSTSGLALFGWINQSLSTATRLRDSQARSQLQLEGVSWLETINPAAEPEGEREMGGLRLTWRATLVEPMQTEFTYGGSLAPRWMIGLYRLNASITRTDGSLRSDWEQVSAGWKTAFVAPGSASPPKAGPAGRS
jgi:general secretion pathway protein I